MNRHIINGIVTGALFALPITWIAAADAIADGDPLTILATAVFGLAAGLCIGALIAANFVMLALEEKEKVPTESHRGVRAQSHA